MHISFYIILDSQKNGIRCTGPVSTWSIFVLQNRYTFNLFGRDNSGWDFPSSYARIDSTSTHLGI